MRLGQTHDPRFADRRNLSQLRDGIVEDQGCVGLFVYVDDADGAAFVASQREVGDVHLVAAKDRPDLADYTWLIVVGDDKHRPAERRLDVDVPGRDEPKV